MLPALNIHTPRYQLQKITSFRALAEKGVKSDFLTENLLAGSPSSQDFVHISIQINHDVKSRKPEITHQELLSTLVFRRNGPVVL